MNETMNPLDPHTAPPKVHPFVKLTWPGTCEICYNEGSRNVVPVALIEAPADSPVETPDSRRLRSSSPRTEAPVYLMPVCADHAKELAEVWMCDECHTVHYRVDMMLGGVTAAVCRPCFAANVD